jgi:molecular chaperone DnaK
MEVSMKLGQAIYEAQQAEENASSGEAGDNVVDADYEEVKDEDDRKKSA